jgi:flagellar biosynthesis GTPase FlhF
MGENQKRGEPMKRKPDKASVHNGRANSKGVAYNANHNTLEASRIHQPHIDQDRIHLNQYLQYMGDGTAIGHRGGGGGYDSRKHELERYRQLYGEGLDSRNRRYIASGHKERVKTMRQVYRDPKTAPMETIFQLGKKGSETDEQTRTQVMVGAWGDVLQHLHQQYGANLIPLDASLHREETTDHIHFRFALGAVDKFGHFMPNQSQALEAMGFQPDSSKPRGRYNNPLVSFTDELRETFYLACERRGIEIDREVTSGSRRQLELLDQKRKGLEKEIAATEQQRQAAQEATQKVKKSLDTLEAKQLLVEIKVEEQQRKAAEATQAAEKAKQEAERAAQQTAQAKATETAIRQQARYEAETTVRSLQAQLREKESIIHNLQAETAKLKTKIRKIKEFFIEFSILENFLAWMQDKSQQLEEDRGEREQ